MTDGKTQLVGLIGWPVEQSLSPVMHNATFNALRMNWQYVPLPVPPGKVRAAVRGLAALGFRGANVTVPHKQTVFAHVDSVAPEARALGAVNTLDVKHSPDGKAIIDGHNTDADGFIGALLDNGFDLSAGSKTVVVGAGGASRAIVYGSLRSGVEEITVLNRTPDRAETLIADLQRHRENATQLRALPLTGEILVESARTSDLLLNATSVGMWPHSDASIWPDDIPVPAQLTVFDLVYNPLDTRLLQQARQAGAEPIDGLGMLVLQGAIAFELWTGKGPTSKIVDLMRNACERQLSLKSS